MGKTSNFPQAPVLVEERTLDDRAARFGKQIVERDFRMPDGKVFPILCVTSPGMDPVIVFAVTEDEQTVFLVNQFRFGVNDWVLELPGGCPKTGQTWEDVARAELLEEVGVEARKMRVIGAPMAFNPALGNVRFTAVLAIGCKVARSQDLDSTEVMTVREIPVLKFRKMLKRGEITDAKSVAIGYLALDHLGLLG